MHLSISILPIYYLYSFISLFLLLSKIQWLLFSLHMLSCAWTRSSCKVHTKSNAIWKQTVSETTKGCMSVSEGSQTDQPCPPPPLLLLFLRQAPRSPLQACPSLLCPLHANLAKAQPALCKMLVYQLSLPSQRKSDYNSNPVRLHLYRCLSVSAISVSLHTSTQTRLFLSFLSVSLLVLSFL